MRRGHNREPQFPQFAIRRRGQKSRNVTLIQRLEPDRSALDNHGGNINHLRSPISNISGFRTGKGLTRRRGDVRPQRARSEVARAPPRVLCALCGDTTPRRPPHRTIKIRTNPFPHAGRAGEENCNPLRSRLVGRRADERGDGVMQFLRQFLMRVHHVSGRIIVIGDVLRGTPEWADGASRTSLRSMAWRDRNSRHSPSPSDRDCCFIAVGDVGHHIGGAGDANSCARLLVLEAPTI